MALPVAPQRLFDILITPSAIRGWWGASRVIVLPQLNGTWAAVWGEKEDEPNYISFARLAAFDPPHRLLFADFQYFARSGPLPFDGSALTTEFLVEPLAPPLAKGGPGGVTRSLLRVTQDGFPADPSADDFYAACETGWQRTFDGIRQFLGVKK